MIELKVLIRRNDYQLNAEISLPDRGITGLVGPSGSGKTSLLRVISGLETPSSGQVACGNDIWFDGTRNIVPTPQRRVGMVFQDMRLFPHLTVQENLDLAAKWGHTAPLSASLIQALELSPLLERMPEKLSGGEARRCALARALAQAPKVLLLDEPLSGLDPAQKARVLPVLARAIELAKIPALFVSHDPDEIGQLCAQYIRIGVENTARHYITHASQPAGPQIIGTVQSDALGQPEFAIGETRVCLPDGLKLSRFSHGTPLVLQGGLDHSFLAEDAQKPPPGFVKIAVSIHPSGGIMCSETRLDIPFLDLLPKDGDHSKRAALYFRPIALFART